MTSATLKMRDVSRAAAALAACLCIGVAASAHAAPVAAAPAVTVSYGDLNLSGDAGTQVLYQRIVKAAAQVCELADIRDLRQNAEAKACRARAIGQAVHEVNSPRLVAVYSAHQPHG